MPTLSERRAAFRALHQTGCFAIPNPWDGGSAVRFAKAGFPALASTSAGAAWALAGALDRKGSVGMLVDQKFKKGAKTTFFGRECQTNPLAPKLARQFDCEVYPARVIRLAGGRYRLELKPRLDLPRNAEGAIDIPASCQALNDVVEGWVREHPEQWMWFHRRWG